MISAALRLGCSNSVSQLFEESDANDVGRSLRDPLDVESLVFLDKLEVYLVALGEAFQQLGAVPSSLVFKVFGLHEHKLFLALEDVMVVTVKEAAVAPFANKLFR